ncbi:hypothetical protein POUND7_000911 [Theobroma cacao]
MIFELVKVRIAWWTKAKWLNLNILVKDLMRFLNQGENHSFSAIARRQVACSRPNDGWIKFNIDSASRGNPRESSIGGVLKDDEEAIKIMFTKPIGVNEVNMTEVLAIREAFKLFSTSKWVMNWSFLIESDLNNVIREAFKLFNTSKWAINWSFLIESDLNNAMG